MKFDSSISTEVPLSKVLDEMIIDGTDISTIVSFLQLHEKDIGDIYGHSAFAYDLYDFAAHPYRMNEFLVEHIYDLKISDMCFAREFLISFLCRKNMRMDIVSKLNVLESIGNSNAINEFRMDGYRGKFIDDIEVASGDVDFAKWADIIVERDCVPQILRESYLSRSLLMATNFLNFSPIAQYIIAKSLKDSFKSPYVSRKMRFLIDPLLLLCKQLLIMNRIDVFNELVAIIDDVWTTTTQMDYVQSRKLPSGIINPGKTFVDVVFDMNLMETQFDTLDLFLYIYIFSERLRDEMKENTDLLEFFNLPFDWRELKLFSSISSISISQ